MLSLEIVSIYPFIELINRKIYGVLSQNIQKRIVLIRAFNRNELTFRRKAINGNSSIDVFRYYLVCCTKCFSMFVKESAGNITKIWRSVLPSVRKRVAVNPLLNCLLYGNMLACKANFCTESVLFKIGKLPENQFRQISISRRTIIYMIAPARFRHGNLYISGTVKGDFGSFR